MPSDGGHGMTALPWEETLWNGIALSHPADWEMLQFSRNTTQGRCAFADRHSFRLELNWRRVSAPPDWDRMWSDYRSRLLQDGTTPGDSLSQGEWQGLAATGTTRWSRYFPDHGLLLELVFIWPDTRDSALESNVLESCMPALPNHGRAFGMDWLTPDHWQLAKGDIKPAQASLTFHDPGHACELRLSRQGLVSVWLTDSLHEWLMKQIGTCTPISPAAIHDEAGHSVTRLEASQAEPMRPWLMRRIAAAAWICPTDGRLYSRIIRKTVSRFRQAGPEPLPLIRLSCCSEFHGE